MGVDIEPTDQDLIIRFKAIRGQAVAAGLDPNTKEMDKFIDNLVMVTAKLDAELREAYNIIHTRRHSSVFNGREDWRKEVQ